MNNITRTHIGRTVLIVVVTLVSTPAFAQIDLNGAWVALNHQDAMERGPGPYQVDYLGLPLNDEGRERALSYDYSIMAQPERQCGYYTPFYSALGPQGLRIWSEADPITGNKIVAWKLSAAIDRDVITIWMDGRPHPSKDAFHPYSGFTTGVWEGDVLTTYTTHIKEGFIRRNGAPSSGLATVTQHIMRHGDLLTITSILEDPVYLTEPHVVSRSWKLDPRVNIAATGAACEPISEVPRFDIEGVVPHFLPGANPFVNELTKIYNIPVEAVLGGAETMYPEYRKKLKDSYVRPAICTGRYCGIEEPIPPPPPR